MSRNPIHLLLVEDDVLEARLLKANLEPRRRAQVEVAPSGEAALEMLERQPFDAVVTDLVMPGIDGIELIRRIRTFDRSLPVILVTAYGSVERAVEGIRAGASEILTKPVNINALLALIDRAVAERPVREAVADRADRPASSAADFFVGAAPRLEAVRDFAEQVARTPGARVLITGETGTGKSLLARAIHDLSGATGRFVEVNCAAIPATLLESELFGHEKGAYTDAREMKRGLIELAHNGTLFLDEIGSLDPDLQGKLLTFLETREIRRVGGTRPIAITTRVIAATNEDLRQRLRDKSFRVDLFYRLDVASIEMPALREVREAIPALARRMVAETCREAGRAEPELTPGALEGLQRYDWPGNVRELRNAVERSLIFHRDGPLHVRAPEPGRVAVPPPEGVTFEAGLTLDEVERRYLESALERYGSSNLEELAEELGIARKTLWEKRRRYGL